MKKDNMNRIYKTIMLIIITSFITFITTVAFVYKKIDLNNFSNLGIKNNNYSVDRLAQTVSLFKKQLEKDSLYEINEEKMLQSALKGYVAGLEDEYTEYFTPEEVAEFLESTNGKYCGVGLYITENDEGEVLIIGPIKNSPAAEAGIKTGDIILKIDDVECIEKKLSENADAMKGEEGTKVKLEIKRDDEILNFELTRKVIVINENKVELLENNIAHITISTFGENTASELKQKIEEVNKDKKIEGIVLDLRNNGGGIVDQAIDVADFFVDKDQVLLRTKSRTKDEKVEKSKTDKYLDKPLVIIVNENTASAAEILAGALKDNLNCTIVGTNTYGKGVIQVFRELSDGSALKITTSEYYTPNHNKINKQGIKPDIEIQVESGKDDDIQLQKAIEELKKKM